MDGVDRLPRAWFPCGSPLLESRRAENCLRTVSACVTLRRLVVSVVCRTSRQRERTGSRELCASIHVKHVVEA